MDFTLIQLENLYGTLLLFSLPVLAVIVTLEAQYFEKPRAGKLGYESADTWMNFKLYGWDVLMRVLVTGLVLLAYGWAYTHRLLEIPLDAWWGWVLLFFAEDLTFYWFHRHSHGVGILWASHVNHHSSPRFNLSTAFRQTPTPFLPYLYWWPLCLIGFHPTAVALAALCSQFYQFWIHTEAIGRLGIFDHWLNTPSNHRVHHGSNPEYADRNFGGWLMVWDRLFGTWQPELPDVPVRYGLREQPELKTVWEASFHEWRRLLHRLRQSRTLPEAMRCIFGPPG